MQNNDWFSLFSNEEPRGERPLGGDAVNKGTQSHRKCVNDEFFGRFRDIENNDTNLHVWFKKLQFLVFLNIESSSSTMLLEEVTRKHEISPILMKNPSNSGSIT